MDSKEIKPIITIPLLIPQAYPTTLTLQFKTKQITLHHKTIVPIQQEDYKARIPQIRAIGGIHILMTLFIQLDL